MINTKITIEGVEVFPDNCIVFRSLAEAEVANTFKLEFNNYNGELSTAFVIGDEVKIYADKDITTPTTQIFLGIVENIKPAGKELKEFLEISGKDYTTRLIDRTVEPETYNNQTAKFIVEDIINKYTDDITTNNVETGDIISRIVFNQNPVYDSIKDLAALIGFMFYIDVDKDLHFKSPGTVASGFTFDGSNIIKTTFNERREKVYNEVWVYGDRYLDAYQETFTGDGTGSTFTTLYNPRNTTIAVDSVVVQPGGIYQQTFTVGSDVKYLVSFDDKQIIFTSGTLQGYNIPGNGSPVLVDYMRDLPIVKVGENDDSINRYGRRVKVIQDTNIKDPLTAQAKLVAELDNFSDPQKEGIMQLNGIANLNVGETCVVNIPIYGIDNTIYKMVAITYVFNKKTTQNENVLTVDVNRKTDGITNTLKDIILQLKKLQSANISDSDLLTRFKWSTGSSSIRESGVSYSTNTVVGSVAHLYSTGFIPPVYPFLLASGTEQGNLAGSFTGSAVAFTPFVIQFSGGYF